MKAFSSSLRHTAVIFLMTLSFSAWSQNTVIVQNDDSSALVADEKVPAALEGIWENPQRYVIFDSSYVSKLNGMNIPTEALKVFYGWYLNRAAESDEYSGEHKRNRNDAEASVPQQLEIHFEPLTWELYPQQTGNGVSDGEGRTLYAGNEISGAWDIQVKYPGVKEIYHVPVAVIGGKLYLNFRIRQQLPSSGESDRSGFWRDYCSASGILISPPYSEKELLSYYFTDSAVYYIRYWETEMEYDSETTAAFSDGSDTYSVPKHLISGDKVFTCVNGRSRKIRNIDKSDELQEKYTLNSVTVIESTADEYGNASESSRTVSTICAIGEPYLVLTDGSRTYEEILQLAAERKRPAQPPLFPPHGLLDFDWSIIEDPPATYDRRMLDLGK